LPMPPLPLPPGWTAADIALITVIGAIVAAVVGATGALAVAWVNARYARKMARDAARRELTAKWFQPYADKINERIVTCHKILTAMANLSVLAEGARAGRLSEEDHKEVTALSEQLVSLSQEVNEQHRSDYDPAMKAHGDQRLIDATTIWIGATPAFIVRAGNIDIVHANSEEISELQGLVSDASTYGALVLAVMQEVIIGRSWWNKTAYWAKRKLGWAEITI
jgi:hypothetical protein